VGDDPTMSGSIQKQEDAMVSATKSLDIYDQIIQSLFGVGLRLEGCLENLGDKPEEMAEIEAVLSAIDRLITDARQQIDQLR
jgi:signal transduction histidine kinase